MIPDDRTSVTSFSVIDVKMREQLRLIIQEPIEDSEIEPFKNAKRLFRACMNTGVIDSLGKAPLETVLNSMGGWPILLDTFWNEGDWTWQGSAVAARANGFSVSSILSFAVSTDNKDSTKRIIRVSFEILPHTRREFYRFDLLDRSINPVWA